MTLAGQKRKILFISYPSPGPEERQVRLEAITPQTFQVSQVSQVPKKSKKRSDKQAGSEEALKKHPAAMFKSPGNPQATLEGLPAELRLQIYDYLCDST